MALAMQYAIVALAVALSLAHLIRRQWPDTLRRLRGRLALRLLADGRSPRLQRLGRAIAPPARASGAGCGGCNGC